MILNPDQQLRLEKATKKLTKNPDDVEALQMRGDLLRVGEDYESALFDFERANTLRSNDPKTLKAIAATKRHLRDYEAAMAFIEKAFEIEKAKEITDAYTLKVRGAIKIDMGNFESALEDLNLADEIDPDNYFTLQRRAQAKRELGLYQQAIDDVNRSILLYPEYYSFMVRGETKRDMGDMGGAIQDLNQAINLAEDSAAQPLRSRAIIKDMLGDLKGSKEDLQAADELEKKNLAIIEEHKMWRKKSRETLH